jgi:hypothetical protein
LGAPRNTGAAISRNLLRALRRGRPRVHPSQRAADLLKRCRLALKNAGLPWALGVKVTAHPEDDKVRLLSKATARRR